MIVLTAKEFRENQKKYFDLASEEIIIIPRANKKPIVISEWNDDEIPSKEELTAIQRGIEDMKESRVIAKRQNESMNEFIERLCID